MEIPEFGFWVQRHDAVATRGEVRRVQQRLRDLAIMLSTITSGRQPDGRRTDLAAAYRADLNEPILGSAGRPQHLNMPTLGDIYIDPQFCVKAAGTGDQPSDEGWWQETDDRDDLPAFLAGYFTAPCAAEAPLVLLGQPGAGKSALTRVLAARLPAADFLPVRVPLRDVPAEIDLQGQIEYALRTATGERITWPELARSAGGALPVVLLDGFDELLQATGVSQSDFLERVAAFQHREAVQQRPVAVVVTSRTAVADRARLPDRCTVVRLEPFTDEQISRWLAIWNAINLAAFAARGLRPFPADLARRYRDLASQPLLMMLVLVLVLVLVLYDAQSNEMQATCDVSAASTASEANSTTLADRADNGGLSGRSGEDATLDTAGLYERLLTSYADREIRKHHIGAAEPALGALVESQLVKLSIAAFAMFNRSQQWVTEADLETDLSALSMGTTVTPRATAGFRSPLTAGQELLGRFFFIQRAQAIRDEQRLQTTNSYTPPSVSISSPG